MDTERLPGAGRYPWPDRAQRRQRVFATGPARVRVLPDRGGDTAQIPHLPPGRLKGNLALARHGQAGPWSRLNSQRADARLGVLHSPSDPPAGGQASASGTGTEDDASISAEAILAVVRSLYTELHRGEPPHAAVDLGSTLERDLGFDSLARVELLRRLELGFRLKLPEATLSSVGTVGDLLRACGAAPAAAVAAVPAVAFQMTRPAGQAGVPSTAATLLDVLDWHAERQPEAVHAVVIVDDVPTPLTYAELRRGARSVAAGLLRAGVQTGSTVALMLPTGIGYLQAFFGVLLAGAVPVPIYPPTRLSQLEEHVRRHAGILSNAGATALLTFAQARTVGRLLGSMAPSLERVLALEDLRSVDALPGTPRGVVAGSIALLQYTSGSTGDPKGVVLTHGDLLANIRAMGKAAGVTHADTFVSWLPLYHDMGLIGAWLGSLYFGCSLILMSPMAFLVRPVRWLRAIHDYRGTLSGCPNFGFELCAVRTQAEELHGLDLSSLRIAFNGAEPVLPQTLERFERRFAPYGFRREAMTPVYGLAEAAVGLAFSPPGRGPRIDVIDRAAMSAAGSAVPISESATDALRIVSCGRALPGYRLRILGPDGVEEPERIEGRVQFTGPSATAGYYRNDAATARLCQGEWRETGDRGYLADGELFVTGRDKDLIIRRGRHIYPQEIEEAVGALDGVRKGCVVVFGARGPASATEQLVILAETRDNDPSQRIDLTARINERVVDILGEPPEEIVLVPAHTVLKTSSGKLRRAATRMAYEAGSLGRVRSPLVLQALRLSAAAAVPLLRRLRRRGAQIAYGVFALLAAAAIAAPAWLLSLLVPRRQQAWGVTRRAARWTVRTCGIPLAVSPITSDLKRPHIIVANHCSYVDAVLLITVLPTPHRFLATTWLARVPLLGAWLRRLGTVFIARSEPIASGGARVRPPLDMAVDSLVVFPEGTFTADTGLRPFHLGAFELAAAARVPVIPVAVQGTRTILRDGHVLPRRWPVRITVGAPLERTSGEDTFSAAVRLRDASRDHILRYCGEPDLG
jgi:1-acyl-sn-glycerol-3-phosphate acyltransferase